MQISTAGAPTPAPTVIAKMGEELEELDADDTEVLVVLVIACEVAIVVVDDEVQPESNENNEI